jgi:hypothetical protein
MFTDLMVLLLAWHAPASAGSWSTGLVEDLTTPGYGEAYTTDPLVPGFEAELRLVYGLWNSPDLQLDVYFDGAYLGSALVDPTVGYTNPGPGTAVFDVTALITANQPYDIEVVAVVPEVGDPYGGEAVIASVEVAWDSDDDLDGIGGLTDCDDADPESYPGAPERCDLVDNDCDGEVDAPDPIDPVALFADLDGDGHGDGSAPLAACAGSPGTAALGDDCDDDDPDAYPGAVEDCAPADRNCDGSPDAGAYDAVAWTADADADGWGGTLDEVLACQPPVGHAAPGDCDDASDTVFPGADETCNGLDDDCDGLIDDAPVDPVTVYLDGDGDGWGGFQAVEACPGRPDTSELGGDCNDSDANVFPGAPEVCDGADQDCDVEVDEDAEDRVASWVDGDGDGFGDAGQPEGLACPSAAGWADNALDCDDGDRSVSPAAEERCNAVDDDCDDLIDNDAVDAQDLFADADGDGFGDPDRPMRACTLDAAAQQAGDCDDNDGAVYPNAPGWGPDCEPLDKGGCGCSGAGSSGVPAGILLALGLALRRRAR